MQIAETIPDYLLAPVTRVAAPNTPAPFSPSMEKTYVPQPARIVEAIRTLVAEY
jgi:pyruvate/2-oxoglutarate/acetoin dehydrogenase E1 component